MRVDQFNIDYMKNLSVYGIINHFILVSPVIKHTIKKIEIHFCTGDPSTEFVLKFHCKVRVDKHEATLHDQNHVIL